MRFLKAALLSACASVLALGAARADVKPHPMFSDNMVLQRDVELTVWGKAARDDVGAWSKVALEAMAAQQPAGDDIALPEVVLHDPALKLIVLGAVPGDELLSSPPHCVRRKARTASSTKPAFSGIQPIILGTRWSAIATTPSGFRLPRRSTSSWMERLSSGKPIPGMIREESW